MHQNPAVVEALARERAAELRRAAGIRGAQRGEARRGSVLAAPRRATGWLLVDVGLRMAVPRPGGDLK